jgi:hypothetical protein
MTRCAQHHLNGLSQVCAAKGFVTGAADPENPSVGVQEDE